jgi:predicted nucleotidyltransferase
MVETSRARSLRGLVTASGFSGTERLIHLFVGGSELHGAKIGQTDDTDIYGVYLETPEEALGLKPAEHFVWSSAGDDRRNGPDDVDITLYSLRKWAHMAAKGNATALHFMFAEPAEIAPTFWRKIQQQRAVFLSRNSATQFRGFAENQMKRLSGEKGQGAKGTRPEYECAFGYDTKAAMHGLRLFFEGIELMKFGRITLPRPEKELLIEIRAGHWSLEKVLAEARQLSQELQAVTSASFLPEHVDKDAISKLIAATHLEFWQVESSR